MRDEHAVGLLSYLAYTIYADVFFKVIYLYVSGRTSGQVELLHLSDVLLHSGSNIALSPPPPPANLPSSCH